jgi:hypothetical protein
MTYHTVLSKSEDFINAMVASHRIASTISDMLNMNNTGPKYEVFPYRFVYNFCCSLYIKFTIFIFKHLLCIL